MLAHLDPSSAYMAPQGAAVIAGDQVGVTSSANHTHWEVRRSMVPAAGETNFVNNTDPIGWLATASLGVGAVLIVGGSALFLWMLYTRRRA
jgi:murein DD-endopeptidase MepM/ murein hydrolase activator NlpD